jgi:hypothetical protein
MLTQIDIKLLIPLLEQAAREFSDHGCNDFDLDEFLTEDERAAFIEEVNAIPNFAGEPQSNYRFSMPDWLVMKALVRKLKDT